MLRRHIGKKCPQISIQLEKLFFYSQVVLRTIFPHIEISVRRHNQSDVFRAAVVGFASVHCGLVTDVAYEEEVGVLF